MPTVLEKHRTEILRWQRSVGFTISGLADAAGVDLRGLRRFFNSEQNVTAEWIEKLHRALRTEEKRVKRLKVS